MFKTTIAFFFFFFLLPIVANKTEGRPHSLHFNKIKLFGATLLQSLLESGINCTQRSHRREKSLRINIDSGMHLFAGCISKEEGFPGEHGGGLGEAAQGRFSRGRALWVPHPAGVFHPCPLRETCPAAAGAAGVLLAGRATHVVPGLVAPRGFRRAPGRTRSPAAVARSAPAAGPCCWGRRGSPRARI